MELVDVLDSKSCGGNTVRVRLPPSAPNFVDVLELVDKIDSESIVRLARGGSSPFVGTIERQWLRIDTALFSSGAIHLQRVKFALAGK